MKRVLVTGGAGYIGSHTSLQLLNNNYHVVVIDNLSNSSKESLLRVQSISGKSLDFVQGDIRDVTLLEELFEKYTFDAVLHFAGLKAVSASCSLPLAYYENNVYGTLTLCQVMQKFDVKTLVFSSSATVYGDPETLPIKEDFPLSATNPYGRSKLMVEEILQDLCLSDPSWSVALLRYFNPVGAHESGYIGEDPYDTPNNLLPYITQVAIGKLAQLSVYGNDYPTVDGTGVRDYIHVVDLADGHVKALDKLFQVKGAYAWNLGVGKGFSVFEVINVFEQVSGKKVPYVVRARRSGDVAECYADPNNALKDLKWKAERSLKQMLFDAWRWQEKNPEGYK